MTVRKEDRDKAVLSWQWYLQPYFHRSQDASSSREMTGEKTTRDMNGMKDRDEEIGRACRS